MCSLLGKLENWGCDTRKALFNMLGDREFYYELLKKFRYDASTDALQKAVAAGDVAVAVKLSHELKGTTATLCLDPLNREISHLLDIIRDGNVNSNQMMHYYIPVEKQLSTFYKIFEEPRTK